MKREDFIKGISLLGLGLTAIPSFGKDLIGNLSGSLSSIHRITNGPKFHWFAYYDKLEIDDTNRYVLGMESDFENRRPNQNDIIKIGMVDLNDNNKWIELGESRAWCWQQGCMLQWIPSRKQEIIWNDRIGDKFVSHILNVKTRKKKTLSSPVYSVSPDGKWAITTDFGRLYDMYPGYGYAGESDKYSHEPAPGNSGIWKLNLDTGEKTLIVSIARIVAIANPNDPLYGEAKHYFNHLLYSPDGERFIFLHRWKYADPARNEQYKDAGGFGTRMLTASKNGDDIRIVDPYNFASHFIWNNNKQILAWSRIPGKGDGFFIYEDATHAKIEQIGKDVMTVNGHCSYLPGDKWILNDTYANSSANREQTLYLYEVKTGKRVNIASLISPEDYKGEWRCDLHPRFSPNGKFVVVDSAHEGMGRQLYLIDISKIV